MDEVYDSLTWDLSRNPRRDTALPKARDFYFFETNPTGNTPAFWVLYTFDENKVYIHSIEAVPNSLEDE